MYYEKKIYNILNEADEFKAKSKETGKVVVFKSKDAMDAAVKGGSHEPLDKPAGGSADKPKGQSVFAKPSGDDAKSSEPKADGGDKYAELDKHDARRAKEADDAIAKHGEGLLPAGTDFNTKLEDLDEDDLEEFYDEMAYDISKKYDVTPAAAADDKMYNLEDVVERGGTIGDMYNATVSSTQEYAEDEGTLKFDENKKTNKQPFREHYNRLFKGRSVL